MENARSDLESIFVTSTMAVLSLFFFVASAVFVIGPSLMAYALGANKNRYKIYGLSSAHALISIVIGEFLFFLIVSLIGVYILNLYDSKIFWYIITASFLLNYLLSAGFYFLGTKKFRIN